MGIFFRKMQNGAPKATDRETKDHFFTKENYKSVSFINFPIKNWVFERKNYVQRIILSVECLHSENHSKIYDQEVFNSNFEKFEI